MLPPWGMPAHVIRLSPPRRPCLVLLSLASSSSSPTEFPAPRPRTRQAGTSSCCATAGGASASRPGLAPRLGQPPSSCPFTHSVLPRVPPCPYLHPPSPPRHSPPTPLPLLPQLRSPCACPSRPPSRRAPRGWGSRCFTRNWAPPARPGPPRPPPPLSRRVSCPSSCLP